MFKSKEELHTMNCFRVCWGVGALALLAALSPAQTITSKTVQLGAIVENVRLEQDSKAAFVRVANHTDKKITAINLPWI